MNKNLTKIVVDKEILTESAALQGAIIDVLQTQIEKAVSDLVDEVLKQAFGEEYIPEYRNDATLHELSSFTDEVLLRWKGIELGMITMKKQGNIYTLVFNPKIL